MGVRPGNGGAAGVGIALFDVAQLVLDQLPALALVVEHQAEAGGEGALFGQLALDDLDFELGEAVELEFENGVGLVVVEPEAVHDALRGVGLVARRADEFDALVEGAEDFLEAFEQVNPLFELLELKGRAPDDHLHPEVEKALEHRHQVHALRRRDVGLVGRHEARQIHVEARLKGRVLEQVRHRRLGVRAAPQFEHDAHVVGGFVAHVHDLRHALVDDVVGDLLDQIALRHAVGDGVDDDLPFALDAVLAAQVNGAFALFVDGLDFFGRVEDAPARGEVRPPDVAEHGFQPRVRAVYQPDQRVYALAQVVRRDVGGHADGDAAGAVDEQVGKARRQHDGFT